MFKRSTLNGPIEFPWGEIIYDSVVQVSRYGSGQPAINIYDQDEEHICTPTFNLLALGLTNNRKQVTYIDDQGLNTNMIEFLRRHGILEPTQTVITFLGGVKVHEAVLASHMIP